MRWLLLALVLLARPAAAFTDAVWTNLPGQYTNIIGRELVNEIWLRDRWAGGSNWWFTNNVVVTYGFSNAITSRVFTNGTSIFSRSLTNQVALTTNVTVTNAFGSPFVVDFGGASITGVVPFEATGAERLTDTFDSLMPAYVWPWFSTGPTYLFDDWWTNDLDRWPGTLYPKAELMNQFPECGIATLGTGTATTLVPEHTGFWEIIPVVVYSNDVPVLTNYPAGWWTKRRDRVDPLIVAEWSRYNAVQEMWFGPITNNWEYYRGWPNEFTSEDSQLFGITNTQYPVFIVHLGGTNAYVADSFSLEQSLESDGIDLWYWYFHSGLVSEWVTNWIESATYDVNRVAPITLHSATQRCDNAWLALGAPLKLTGTPPNVHYVTNIASGVTNIAPHSSDTVSLQYTNRMNTYEGNKAWDAQLLPEQLTAHYIGLTNAFLTPWTSFVWTNSTAYAYETNINVGFTNDHTRNLTVSGGAYSRMSFLYGGVVWENMSVNGEYICPPLWGTTWTGPVKESYYYPQLYSYRIQQITADVYDLYAIGNYTVSWRSSNGVVGVYSPHSSFAYWWDPDTILAIPMGDAVVSYQKPEHLSDSTATNCPRYPTPSQWFWIDLASFPLFPNPWVLTGAGPTTLASNVAPFEAFTATAEGDFLEEYTYRTRTVDTNNDPVVWNGTVTRTETPISIVASGTGVVSSLAVTGLYTGTPHRVHLYARSPKSMAPVGPSEHYHRIGIYPIAFTNAETIITDPIDPRQTNAWAVTWSSQFNTSVSTNADLSSVGLEPYISFSVPDPTPTNFTHIATSSMTNLVTNGWQSVWSGMTNIAGTNLDMAIFEPTFSASISSNSTTNTVCGWAGIYYADWGQTPKTPPASYTWPGYTVSNAVITNTSVAETNLVIEMTNGMPTYVYLSTYSGQIPPYFVYSSDVLYVDTFSLYATLQYSAGVWTIYNWNSDPIYYSLNGIAGQYTSTDPMYDPAPYGYLIATNYVGMTTNSTHRYEVIPDSWEKWTNSTAYHGRPENDYDPDDAWIWESYYKSWTPKRDTWWWGYQPVRTPGFKEILVQKAKPPTTDVVVGYHADYSAREWLTGATNWNNEVGVKVLIEWQR